MSLLSTKQAAAELGISAKTLRGHVRDGTISYIVVGRGKTRPGIAFAPKDIEDFIRRDREPEAPPAVVQSAPGVDFQKARKTKGQKVYFIKAGDAVKIGIAVDPKRRLSTLQVARHEKLELLLVLPGGAALEAKLHERFSALSLSGEWFRYEGRLRAFIERRRAP